MGIDFDQLRQAFVAETEEDLDLVEQALLTLEKDRSDSESLAVVFRKVHTFKGNTRSLGLTRAAEFAHSLEDLLDKLRGDQATLTAGHITYLLRAVDALRQLLPCLARGEDELTPACVSLRRRVADGQLQSGSESEAQSETELAAEGARTVRIETTALDRLLNMTTEMAILRGRLGRLLAQNGRRDEVETFDTLERLSTELHRFVTRIRLVPVAPLLRWQERVVRDTAQEQRKKVELEVSDQGVEVDTSILERLRAPLSHMIRNAVSHGIETPGQRKKRGKPATGRIGIRARYSGSGIAIEVEDDGAGLDRARILEKAVALGVVPADASLGEAEIDRLIFNQGLSTARQVTGISGRGIGMDVVSRHVETIGGFIEVKSTPGGGSCFTVRMPLTLAIIDGFVVEAAAEVFVIPMAGVVRCVDLSELSGMGPEAVDDVLDIQGSPVPAVRLRSILSRDGSTATSEIVVVCQVEDEEIGIVADRLVGKQQVVVEPPGPHFKGLRSFSGMTILGDGTVAPIISVASLLRQCIHEAASRTEEPADV